MWDKIHEVNQISLEIETSGSHREKREFRFFKTRKYREFIQNHLKKIFSKEI